MDFAPYQDSDPSTHRALSPPPPHPRRALSPSPNPTASRSAQQQPSSSSLPAPSTFQPSGSHLEDGRLNIALFETSLPLRLDHEAMLAYLGLPPAGAVLLLMLEHRSDYVRFHAWQSAMVFSALFVLHLVLAWSAVLSWLLFVGDLALIGCGCWRAWRDGEGAVSLCSLAPHLSFVRDGPFCIPCHLFPPPRKSPFNGFFFG